ncbi:MAG: radical SAM protein [Limisphaerales bacterium]
MRLADYAVDVVRTRMGRRTLPRFLTYLVTFTCNARCIMCDSWRKPSPDDLTLEELSGVYDQLPRMDAVRLSGGEPFVRPDLVEISNLTAAKLRPLVIHITSNGFLTDRIVGFCENRSRSVPLRLLISMDGLREKHNQIRGRATAFDSAVAALKALAPRREELRLHLSVNQTVVDEEGVEQYRLLREFLRPLGIRNQVVLAYDVSATYSVANGINVAPRAAGKFATFGKLTPERVGELVEEARADSRSLPFHERAARRYYLDGIRHRILDGVGEPNPACVALNSHLRILPNGDVPTCQFNGRVIGNLRRQSFHDVWFGSEGVLQREWVRQCPGCWAECEVLPSAIYSGDLWRGFLPRWAGKIGLGFGGGRGRPLAPDLTQSATEASGTSK